MSSIHRGTARSFLFLAVTTLGTLTMAPPAVACQSCGCTLSDWSTEGYSPGTGLRMDYRFDYIDQKDLRSGKSAADRTSFIYPASEEVQQQTLTRFQNLSLDWSPDATWGLNVLVPVLDRYHTTVAAGDTQVSTSDESGVGDARIIGRYQGFLPNRSVGVQMGLKLPTGAYRDTFSQGPQAGEPLDRGLQLGTGTTDLIAGIFNGGALSRSFDRFEALQVQMPLNAREDFRPGSAIVANVGARYLWRSWFTPQLQLNARWEGRESGAQADRTNSGSTTIMLSPGVAVGDGNRFIAFAVVQVPVYERYNGLALAPDYTASVGLRFVP